MKQVLTIEGAVVAALGSDMERLIEARSFAERLGFDAFEPKAAMPPEFVLYPVLAEGFDEGFKNAECERELVRRGLL